MPPRLKDMDAVTGMDAEGLLLQLLIVMGAIVFGVASGRAKADRLRQLGRDLKTGQPRGYAVIGIVALLSIASLMGLFR